ncbi:MAG: hypothetical protein Q8T13_14670 [Acidobacteriota bacterium]|nr:hypothetical protein [Acidobacteriota bacterium]
MTTIRQLRTSFLVAALALLTGTASSDGLAGAERLGIQRTPNGYRVPVYGMSFTRNAEGTLGTECARLTAPQLEAARFRPAVSRALMVSYPHATIQAASGATFTIIYTDAEGTGFNDPARGAARKAAMQASVAAWSAVLQGTVPIVVDAKMETPEDPESTLLASAGPIDFFDLDGVAVPSALAAQVRNRSLNNGGADIQVLVNETVDWDYAINGAAAPGKASFVYTMIHEVGHGLGFLDSFDVSTGQLMNSIPFPYDVFVNRGSAGADVVANHGPEQVLADLTSNDLFFSGPKAVEASARSIRPLPMVKLYAPDPYEPGSSIAHLDQDTYADFKTGLMTPRDFGSGTNKIDILTLGIMADIGYQLVPGAATARTPRR